MDADRPLSCLCVYSGGVRILRREETLEAMIMKLPLAAAISTVSRYMTALQSIPIVSRSDNPDEYLAELTVLYTSIDVCELLNYHTLRHKQHHLLILSLYFILYYTRLITSATAVTHSDIRFSVIAPLRLS